MYIAELIDSNLPQRVFKLTEQLLDGFASHQRLELNSSNNLFTDTEPGLCFKITSGSVEAELGNKLLYFLEPGDFIGPQELQFAGAELVFKCSRPVSLQCYAWEDILAMLQRDAQRLNTWMQLQAGVHGIVLHALARHRNPVEVPDYEQLDFAPHEIIIKRDATATHVYKLLSGSAEATQRGVKVGVIRAGDIFGSLAVFAGQKRSATVTAVEKCTVQAISKDDFIDMLRLQPETCCSLFETMAGRIIELNEAMRALEPAMQAST